MKKLVLLILSFVIIPISMLLSQNEITTKGQKDEVEIPKFLIKPKYPENLAFVYKRTTDTKLTQLLSDSTKRTFQRILDIYFTFYTPGKPVDGFTEFRVSIDSLVYRYIVGTDTIYYNSQDDEAVPPFKLQDFDANSLLLGKEFTFNYSAYWDVGKIGGMRLEQVRRYINDPIDGIDDTLRKYFWNYRLSDQYLASFVDILKKYMPNKPLDTTQIRNIPFFIDIEETQYFDTAKVKFLGLKDNQYILKGTMNNLKNVRPRTRIPGFQVLVDLVHVEGKGEYTVLITPQGRVDGSYGHFNIEMLLRDRNELIYQKIEEKLSYQLLKNYKI